MIKKKSIFALFVTVLKRSTTIGKQSGFGQRWVLDRPLGDLEDVGAFTPKWGQRATNRMLPVLGAFSVQVSADIIWSSGGCGHDGPHGRAQAPTGADVVPFRGPKRAILGLDLGGGCAGLSLTPVRTDSTMGTNDPPPNAVEILFLPDRFLSKNGKRSNASSLRSNTTKPDRDLGSQAPRGLRAK